LSTFIVSSVAVLNAQLAVAHAGDVIELAGGTYSGLAIKGLNFTSPVTITSADPANPAVITDMSVVNAAGLNFTNLEFSFAAATTDSGTYAFGITVSSCSNIHFNSDSIHGILDVAPDLDVKGIRFLDSSNVSVSNSELQYLRVGISNENDSSVSITGDNFHDLRVDGIDTFGTSYITISDNNFSNFHRLGTPATGGDHGDAIQFWTGGTTASARYITITNNVIVQGQGEVAEGVFMTDSAGYQYKAVTISDNLIVGGAWNGIHVTDVWNLQVTGNTLVGLTTESQTPWIDIEHGGSVVLSNNGAMKFVLKYDTGVTQSGDVITQAVSDQGLATITDWLATHDHPMTVGLITPYQLIHDSLT